MILSMFFSTELHLFSTSECVSFHGIHFEALSGVATMIITVNYVNTDDSDI